MRDLGPVVVCGALAGCAVVVQAALLSRAVDAAFLGRAPLALLAPPCSRSPPSPPCVRGSSGSRRCSRSGFSGDVRLDVRDRLVRRLLALGPRYVSGERTGELANTLVGGVEALDAYVAQYLPQAGARRARPGARARGGAVERPAVGARAARSRSRSSRSSCG